MNQKASLTNRSVISVHTKPETTKRLDKLATQTRRSKSFLANEAIERYLNEEEDFAASIKRGMADVQAGRVHTTEEVRSYIQKVIENSKSA
jgi:predicted transcriptional regulator